MNGPFPLDAVIARIATLPEVSLAGNAADLEAALNTPPRAVPAVYVLSDESGKPTLGATGRALQPITVTLKLVMWVRNAGGAARIVAEMAQVETALRAALFGWHPSSDTRPLTVRASGSEQAWGNHLVRQLLLSTEYTQTTA